MTRRALEREDLNVTRINECVFDHGIQADRNDLPLGEMQHDIVSQDVPRPVSQGCGVHGQLIIPGNQFTGERQDEYLIVATRRNRGEWNFGVVVSTHNSIRPQMQQMHGRG